MSRTLRIYLAAVAGGPFAPLVFATGGRAFPTPGHGPVTPPPVSLSAVGLGPAVAWSINASVEDWRRPHLISDGIFLEFRLDSAYKLISADVDESWTMP